MASCCSPSREKGSAVAAAAGFEVPGKEKLEAGTSSRVCWTGTSCTTRRAFRVVAKHSMWCGTEVLWRGMAGASWRKAHCRSYLLLLHGRLARGVDGNAAAQSAARSERCPQGGAADGSSGEHSVCSSRRPQNSRGCGWKGQVGLEKLKYVEKNDSLRLGRQVLWRHAAPLCTPATPCRTAMHASNHRCVLQPFLLKLRITVTLDIQTTKCTDTQVQANVPGSILRQGRGVDSGTAGAPMCTTS